MAESAIETLLALANGDAPLRLRLAADRLLVPRVLRLISAASAASPSLYAAKRAAQLLQSLAETPEALDALRAHEWMLMHFAMSDPTNAGPLTVEVLEILNSH